MDCIKNAGPERQRWVNQSGCPMGAEVNNVNMIGELRDIKGVALWMTGSALVFIKGFAF
jgi:hypothetical protein